MAISWKSWFSLLYICPLLYKVVAERLQLEPLNLTVVQGSDTRFKATVQGEWEFITWSVKGLQVLSINRNGDTFTSEKFSARMCVINVTDCVEFTIHNVSRTDAGPVICAGDRLLPKTAQLYVQENGTVSIIGGNTTVTQDHLVEFKCVSTAWYPSPSVSWTLNGQAVDSSLYNTTSMADGDSFNSTSILTFRAVRDTTVECMAAVPALKTPQSSSVFMVVVPTDWTVLIAIVLSFAGFALLVLLILGIIFCYKRRKAKEPNYQDELRRVRTQSQLSVNALGQKQGQVNPSFVGQTNIIPRDSGSFQLDYINVVETSGVANSNLAGNGAVDELGFHKHRHATTV